MRKLLSSMLSIVVLLSLILPFSASASYSRQETAAAVDYALSIKCESTAEVLDNSDFEAISLDEQRALEKVDDGLYLATITSASAVRSQASEKDDGVCVSTLRVYFSMSADLQDIKMSRVTGSWGFGSASSGVSLTLEDSYVMMTTGAVIGGYANTWYPTTSSFDYSTGWGYAQYYPNAQTPFGSRAVSGTNYSISGMAHMNVQITNVLEIDVTEPDWG